MTLNSPRTQIHWNFFREMWIWIHTLIRITGGRLDPDRYGDRCGYRIRTTTKADQNYCCAITTAAYSSPVGNVVGHMATNHLQAGAVAVGAHAGTLEKIILVRGWRRPGRARGGSDPI